MELLLLLLLASERSERDTYRGNTIENRMFVYLYICLDVCMSFCTSGNNLSRFASHFAKQNYGAAIQFLICLAKNCETNVNYLYINRLASA